MVVQPARSAGTQRSFDGVVEALRQTDIGPQVSGAVVDVAVKAGQTVKAGQLLLRIDARAAEQTAAASTAQAQAERAALALAASDLERQRQLRHQGFISAAALERAEAEFKASDARHRAQIAQAEASRTDVGLHALRAPYAGLVAEVPAMPGEMALPGRTLVQLYDPSRLRVSVHLPQALAINPTRETVRIEITDEQGAVRSLQPSAVELLPLADAATQTATLRAELPPGTPGLAPGRFARVWLTLPPGATAGPAPLTIPTTAVFKRGEMTALYVLDGEGRPLLRQVRLAAPRGDQVEVLSGLRAGERLVLEPAKLALEQAR
jgi:RND family efflux transporter MFP subunit